LLGKTNNSVDVEVQEIAGLRAKAKEAKLEKGRVAGTRPTLSLADYTGTYADPLFGEVHITQDGGSLRLAQGPEMRARLEHWHYDTWKAVWDMEWVDPVFVRFLLDPQGRASSLDLGGLGDPDEARVRLKRSEEKPEK
jgi:hypothetical protein